MERLNIAFMSIVIDYSSDLDPHMKKLIEEIQNDDDFSSVLMNYSLDAIVTYDSELRYVDFNLAAEKLTGLKKEQVIGRTPFELFPVINGTSLGQALLDTQKGITTRCASSYKNPEGGEVVIAGIHSPLKNGLGKIAGAISIVRDTNKKLELGEFESKSS